MVVVIKLRTVILRICSQHIDKAWLVCWCIAIGGWSGLARCPRTVPSYLRLPHYRPLQDMARMPPRPQCRLDGAVQHSQFPSSCVSRSCPPSAAQFCGSPYPVHVYPSTPGASYFDVLDDAARSTRSGCWAVGRWQRALSPTVEELSPAAGTPTTTTPVSRRHAGIDNYIHWEHQNRRHRSALAAGPHQYSSNEGQQSSVDSGGSGRLDQGRLDQFAEPWSTSAEQPLARLPSTVETSGRQPRLPIHWQFRGRHTHHETF